MKWTLILCLAGPAFACQPVDGERILGKDLAAANSLFAALDPALDIGPTPMAGARRLVHAPELFRLARENSLAPETPFGEICFERATQPLTSGQLLPILHTALGIDDARIEILDYSRYGLPRGELEFTRAGLSSSGMWRGRIAYAENRTMPVWAKVRITTEQRWVEARTPLAPAKPIDPSQLVLRTGPRFPLGTKPLDSVQAAAGQAPLRAIQPGTPLYASMLVTPREVERGDKITVEISSGAARLSFESRAESPGRAGESILVRNPENGRLFQARVQARGKVSVKL